MTQDEKIKALREELKSLESKPKPFERGLLETPESAKESVFYPPYLAKNIASGFSSIADLPFLAGNLIRKGLGKEQVSYPSEKTQKIIESYLPSTKPRNEMQRKAESYMQGVASLAPWNIAGKLNVAGKVGSKILNKMGEYTLPNVAGTLGGIYGAKTLSEANPDSIASPLAGAAIGSMLSRGAVSGAKSLAQTPSKTYNWFIESNPKAALRDPQIGDQFIRDIPYSFEASKIMGTTRQKAGEHVQKGFSKYLDKQSKYWSAETQKVKEPLLSNPKLNEVNISEPLQWSIDKLKSFKDPLLKKQFMDSPLGRETLEVLELPKSTSAAKLLKTIEKNPKLLDRTMNFDDAWAYRRSIDNTISKKGWAGLGSHDERELTQFRHHIDNTLGKTFEKVSPEAYSNWKDYKSRYDSYLNREKKPALEIIADKHHPTKIYESAISGAGNLDSPAELTLKALKGKDRQYYAESLIRDLGRKGDEFDLPTFYKKYIEIESPQFKRLLMNSLPSKVSKGLQEQIQIYKGFTNIRNQPKGLFSTLIYNQPSLSLASKVKKVFKRQSAAKYYQTPIGRERLAKAALKSAEHKPVMLPAKGSTQTPMEYLGNKGLEASRSYAITQANQDKTNLDQRLNDLRKEAESLGIDTSNLKH